MVAVIFDNFGPYLWARVNASGARTPVFAVELYGRSTEYAWNRCSETGTVRFATLLPGADSRAATASAIARRLETVFSENHPDAVAIPGWSFRGALVVLQWCLKHQIPAVVMSETTAWDEPRVAWKEAVKRRIVALFSAALVGGTPHADYMAQLGQPRDRIFLGYDAVDNDYFARGAKEARSQESEVRRKYGLPERYFLASARFIEKKNLPRLLQAYARYRKLCEESEISLDTSPSVPPHEPQNAAFDYQQLAHFEVQGFKARTCSGNSLPDRGGEGSWKSEVTTQNSKFKIQNLSKPWDLVLLGDGPLRSDLCRLISDLSLQNSVHLPGFKQYPDLPAYYGLAGAFIHASTVEQWGLVVNEAMSSGLPVLVSNRCGCAPDLVREGENGFTFDPENAEQLAPLMLRLAASPLPRLAEMGDASRQIISNWGLERFASGLQAAAECALEVGPKRAGFFDRLLLWALVHRSNA